MNVVSFAFLDKSIFGLLKPGRIFKTGICKDSPEGVNMSNSGKPLRWVAVKGHARDWCIYVHWDFNSAEWIAGHGDKVNFEEHIRKLVPCSDDVFKLYRY